MINITLTQHIRRYCVLSNLPRVRNGHIVKCGAGKLHKFRRLLLSTDKGSKPPDNIEKCERIIKYIFSNTKAKFPAGDIKGFTNPLDRKLPHIVAPHVTGQKLTSNKTEDKGISVNLAKGQEILEKEKKDINSPVNLENQQKILEEEKRGIKERIVFDESLQKPDFSFGPFEKLPLKEATVKATTDKQKENEEPAQKIEKLEEPSLVEPGKMEEAKLLSEAVKPKEEKADTKVPLDPSNTIKLMKSLIARYSSPEKTRTTSKSDASNNISTRDQSFDSLHTLKANKLKISEGIKENTLNISEGLGNKSTEDKPIVNSVLSSNEKKLKIGEGVGTEPNLELSDKQSAYYTHLNNEGLTRLKKETIENDSTAPEGSSQLLIEKSSKDDVKSTIPKTSDADKSHLRQDRVGLASMMFSSKNKPLEEDVERNVTEKSGDDKLNTQENFRSAINERISEIGPMLSSYNVFQKEEDESEYDNSQAHKATTPLLRIHDYSAISYVSTPLPRSTKPLINATPEELNRNAPWNPNHQTWYQSNSNQQWYNTNNTNWYNTNNANRQWYYTNNADKQWYNANNADKQWYNANNAYNYWNWQSESAKKSPWATENVYNSSRYTTSPPVQYTPSYYNNQSFPSWPSNSTQPNSTNSSRSNVVTQATNLSQKPHGTNSFPNYQFVPSETKDKNDESKENINNSAALSQGKSEMWPDTSPHGPPKWQNSQIANVYSKQLNPTNENQDNASQTTNLNQKSHGAYSFPNFQFFPQEKPGMHSKNEKDTDPKTGNNTKCSDVTDAHTVENLSAIKPIMIDTEMIPGSVEHGNATTTEDISDHTKDKLISTNDLDKMGIKVKPVKEIIVSKEKKNEPDEEFTPEAEILLENTKETADRSKDKPDFLLTHTASLVSDPEVKVSHENTEVVESTSMLKVEPEKTNTQTASATMLSDPTVQVLEPILEDMYVTINRNNRRNTFLPNEDSNIVRSFASLPVSNEARTNIPATIGPLPCSETDVPLSLLLKSVRLKNAIDSYKGQLLEEENEPIQMVGPPPCQPRQPPPPPPIRIPPRTKKCKPPKPKCPSPCPKPPKCPKPKKCPPPCPPPPPPKCPPPPPKCPPPCPPPKCPPPCPPPKCPC